MTAKGFESIDAAQRDHSSTRLNASVCQAALAFVHHTERLSRREPGANRFLGTLVALEKLLSEGPVVTRPEFETVCGALNVAPREVPLAVTRWYGEP